jgi:hypothetical protein
MISPRDPAHKFAKSGTINQVNEVVREKSIVVSYGE